MYTGENTTTAAGRQASPVSQAGALDKQEDKLTGNCVREQVARHCQFYSGGPRFE